MEAKKLLRAWAGMACVSGLVVLSGCGGGGSAGTPVLGGGGTGTGTVTPSPKLSVALSSTTVTAATPATVTATLQDAAGNPIGGQIVTFSTTGGLGKFSVATALTNEAGVATAAVSPASTVSAGADEAVASVNLNGTALTAKQGFQLTATNVAIAQFLSDLGTVSAYGNTNLTVQLSGTVPTVPVTVQVTSSCVTAGRAVLTPTTQTTATGTASFTFRDGGTNGSCGATQTEDNLSVSIVGSTESKSIKLNLSKPSAGQIAFVSSTPNKIYLANSGLVTNAVVKFSVRDANGNGVPGQSVDIAPVSLAGDLKIEDRSKPSDFPITLPADPNGDVLVRVNAGTVPTAVSIKATIRGTSISTVSSDLSIGVGLPSQNKLSLALGTLNIEGYNRDNVPNSLTVTASDRSGNPVPDGTTVNFWTGESGQVETQKKTALNERGLASVTANFVTSGTRPLDGRITVVAYSLGEESFIDKNKNNIYDEGEDFQDLGDVFLDRLFNGSFNPSKDESRSQQDGAGSQACVNSSDELLALDGGAPSVAGTCDRKWGKAYVRSAQEMVLSTSSAGLIWGTRRPSYYIGSCDAPVSITHGYSTDDSPVKIQVFPITGGAKLSTEAGKRFGSFLFYATDANPYFLNPMAAGTTISATATEGITVTIQGGGAVASTTHWSSTAGGVYFKFDDKTSDGTLTLRASSPSGLTTVYNIDVTTTAGTACP